MNIERRVRRLNNQLGAELGRVLGEYPLYQWIFSEDPILMHPMRIENTYDYAANPETGLIEPKAVYKKRKMCLNAENQWVLCHWIESPPFEEWRRIFSDSLEWPKGGQYYPTNVTLDPGVAPCEVLTQTVIDFIREDRRKTPKEVADAGALVEEKNAAAEKVRLYEEIRDSLTTYDHVPGTRDQVSYPSK